MLQFIIGVIYGFLILTLIYPILRTLPRTIGLVIKGILRKTSLVHQVWSFVFALIVMGLGAIVLNLFTSAALFFTSWGFISGAVTGFVMAWMAPGGTFALQADYADFITRHLAEPSAIQQMGLATQREQSQEVERSEQDDLAEEYYDDEADIENSDEFDSDDLEAEIERKNIEIERLETELEIRRLKADCEGIVEEGGREWFDIIRRNDTEDREILSEIVPPISPFKAGSVNWLFHKANLDLLNGDVESAVQQFSKMIELEPTKHLHFYLRSRANLSIGNIYEFFDDYESAIHLANGEELPFLDVYELLKKMPDAMIDRISEKLRKIPLQAISIKEPNAETRAERLRELKEELNKNPQLAITADRFLQETEFSEYSDQWYVQKALKHWREGERETALEFYNSALKINPDDELTLLNRGNLLFELGYFDEAFKDLEKAVELNPEVPADLLMFKQINPNARESIRQNMTKKNRSSDS